MKKLTRNSYPGLLCGIAILILTGLPGSCFPQVKPTLGLDKVAHLVMFAGFAFVSLWGYRDRFIGFDKSQRRKALTRALIISIAFGALTEIMQETLCYQRFGSIYDFIADVIGILIGITLFAFFSKKKNKNNERRVS